MRVAGVRVHLSHGLSASGGRTIKLHGTTEANTEQRGQVRCLSLCAHLRSLHHQVAVDTGGRVLGVGGWGCGDTNVRG